MMLIFWDQRLVFLATPKAGSTAIEVALEPLASLAVQRPPAMKHVDAEGFHRHLEPWLREMTSDRFTTVALMREPIDWLRSWYRFRQRDDLEEQGTGPTLSFDAFAASVADRPGSQTGGIDLQSRFLTGGSHAVDRIFRYEDIDAFTRFLDDRLGCEIVLPRINVPPEADVSLGADTEARLRAVMKPDFELYASLA